jgi:hypothetical protein
MELKHKHKMKQKKPKTTGNKKAAQAAAIARIRRLMACPPRQLLRLIREHARNNAWD